MVDADDLERLAKLLTDKRQLAEQYYARACRLVGQAQATPLAAMLRWAGETATELGNRAAIARSAERAETHSARCRNSASPLRSAQFPARIEHGSKKT
ncbi:hypothetical protein [Microbispora sp. GKU 823]|uniref:hypothetical protein n=1 Tax=Microbispora sp. GKU 823 TaxID=1652100 RepID=UPI0015C4219A|nr:hypothetical protein [Microbispora sp. GKU 823]